MPPRLRPTGPPTYPQGAAGDARVMLEIIVSAEGTVDDSRVVVGDEPFESAAIAAARDWQFMAKSSPFTEKRLWDQLF